MAIAAVPVATDGATVQLRMPGDLGIAVPIRKGRTSFIWSICPAGGALAAFRISRSVRVSATTGLGPPGISVTSQKACSLQMPAERKTA